VWSGAFASYQVGYQTFAIVTAQSSNFQKQLQGASNTISRVIAALAIIMHAKD